MACDSRHQTVHIYENQLIRNEKMDLLESDINSLVPRTVAKKNALRKKCTCRGPVNRDPCPVSHHIFFIR